MTLSQLRPATPAHLAAVGVFIWLIGSFFHAAGVLVPPGLALLLLAGVGWLVRPRR